MGEAHVRSHRQAQPLMRCSFASNFVIDAPFSAEVMAQPRALLQQIKLLTGVLEVGLFVDVVQAAYFGNQDGTITTKVLNGKTVDTQEGVTFDVTQPPAAASA